MIAFASLLLAQAIAAVAPAPEGTILNPVPLAVVEERLSAISASVAQTSSGGWQCALTGSTGSAYVDDRLCQATARCSIRHTNNQVEYADCLQSERREILKDFDNYSRGETE